MMKTPICDFVNGYNKSKKVRFHMPGHKGKSELGFENNDITEIDGADNLYFSSGIISESENNASTLFECDTFYSTEGSSHCIRAMLFLALMNRKNKEDKPIILALRNVHKTFITASALLDFDVEWLYSNKSNSYHSCIVDDTDVDKALKNMQVKPFAVYLTSPDYLGNVLPIKPISKVCKKYGIPLLVDNAHGAYLKFIEPSSYPIDLGATMCADSAHKTLPALTGAAYLHIAKDADSFYKNHVKEALSLFGSTSPSYLILESLDRVNMFISDNIRVYNDFSLLVDKLKKELVSNGYKLVGNEKMKITIDAKAYGYTGDEIAEYLLKNNISSEFHDSDFLCLMLSPKNTIYELEQLKKALLSLTKKDKITKTNFILKKKEKAISIREATFSKRETINIEDAYGRILADTAVVCPPAIPIVVSGEIIDLSDIEMFKYYGVLKCSVVKK